MDHRYVLRVATLLSGLLLGAGLAGCSPVYLSDDVDWRLTFENIVTNDNLNGPYVVGSSFGVTANTRNDNEPRTGWTLRGPDPHVLALTSSGMSAAARAVAPGAARIQVLDDEGDLVHEVVVNVVVPDRVELYFRGWMLLDWAAEPSSIRPVHVMQGGTGTFLVRYFSGERELFGNGALEATADPSAITVSERTTFFGKNREWLSVTPLRDGDIDVDLRVGGFDVATHRVVGVHPTAIQALGLFGEDESKADEDDTLNLLGVGFDSSGHFVYGLDFSWRLDNQAYSATGDLFKYRYDPEETSQVTASFGGLSTNATIHGESGYVWSTNKIGCNGAGHTPFFALIATMAIFGVALWRTRRRDD